MNPRKPIDLTGPDAEFEALLRRRIHELADHAPTAVRVVDEVAVRRAVTAKRGRSLLAVAATVAVMAGAGALAVFVVSDGDTAGAASPDAAVTELAAALRSEDLLEVIAVIDPAEVPAIQAGIDEGRSGAEQEGAISDELLLERLQGIDSAFSDQAFDTEELAPDLAVVTPLGGSASTTSDPADVHIATVKRDGRWFVSLQYSIAESIRRRSGSPFPTDPPVVPVGAAGPEAAAEAFYRHLLDGDAAGLATTFAPGEGDALLRYASLWVPALQDRFDEARLPGDGAGHRFRARGHHRPRSSLDRWRRRACTKRSRPGTRAVGMAQWVPDGDRRRRGRCVEHRFRCRNGAGGDRCMAPVSAEPARKPSRHCSWDAASVGLHGAALARRR
jgi:hypothetical protein